MKMTRNVQDKEGLLNGLEELYNKNRRKIWIEISVTRIIVRHQGAWQMMQNIIS